MPREVPKYECREDFVLIQIQQGPQKLIAFPQQSREGKRNVVLAKGPKVENLEIGDRVQSLGSPDQQGVTYVFLPGRNDLFVTRQSNVCIVERDGWLIEPVEDQK